MQIPLTVGIVKSRTAAFLECQNGIRRDRNLLAQLTLHSSAGCNCRRIAGIIRNGTTTSAEGIVTATIDRLTLAKADSYVALEAYVVAGGEFEGIEAGQQTVGIWIVFPVAEDTCVCGAAILVCHQILILHIILHGLGNAGTCEAAINSWREQGKGLEIA